MRIVLRILLGIFAVLVLAVVVQMVAAETGEVAVLYVTDAESTVRETRVWVVEQDGALFVRGGSQPGGWSERAAAHPEVQLERGGQKRSYQAVPRASESTRKQINGLFAEKYGWRDAYISYFVADPTRERVRILELEPRGGP